MTATVDHAAGAPLLDPYSYDFHEDPYPYYRRLRDEGSAVPQLRSRILGVVPARRRVGGLSQFHRAVNKFGVSLDPASRGPHAALTMSFLAMDDPAHLRLRTLVSKGFTPRRRIRELEPRVTEIANQHLDTMLELAASGETVDYVHQVAGKLPMDVISELMGVPEPDRQEIRAWADAVMHRDDDVTDVPKEAIKASINLFGYYHNMIAERRKRRRRTT